MVSSTIASIYSCGSIHSTVNGEIIIEYFFIIAVFQVNEKLNESWLLKLDKQLLIKVSLRKKVKSEIKLNFTFTKHNVIFILLYYIY